MTAMRAVSERAQNRPRKAALLGEECPWRYACGYCPRLFMDCSGACRDRMTDGSISPRATSGKNREPTDEQGFGGPISDGCCQEACLRRVCSAGDWKQAVAGPDQRMSRWVTTQGEKVELGGSLYRPGSAVFTVRHGVHAQALWKEGLEHVPGGAGVLEYFCSSDNCARQLSTFRRAGRRAIQLPASLSHWGLAFIGASVEEKYFAAGELTG
jgi:hypothetical protein